MDLRWYHTIELPGGDVTPGYVDTRRAAAAVPLPSSLRGKRCLDVGTRDGFWAFEMERRGAAEVVAVDVAGGQAPSSSAAAFAVAHGRLRSKVDRRELALDALTPDGLGMFDVVFCGALTLGLRDPVGALAAIRSVCRELLVYEDAIDAGLSRWRRRSPYAALDGRGQRWWRPNLAALARVAESGGFDVVGAPVRFEVPYGAGGPSGSDPHAAVLCRPRAA